MKKDVFSDLKYDLIDDTSVDPFDIVELDLEEKILYSDEFKALLKEELAHKIDGIPFQKLIDEGVAKQLAKNDFPGLLNKTKESIETKIYQENFRAKFKLTEDLEKMNQEIKEKYASIRNILNSQQQYTFGGFAPPNPLTGASGTFLKNTNQTWNGLQWAVGGATIGSPVSGGVANEVLFIGPTGLLAQSPNFKYHGITTGDFNKLDMGTDGRVILQSGNLDPGTGGSESSTVLQMTDASSLNYFPTIEGGLIFGASLYLDDSEGQFDFVTTQLGDPRLDMWGFHNAQVNFINCDPGQCGQSQGSQAADVAYQKANNPARITVDGGLYANKVAPNRYGRNLIITGESNNNGGTGGDIRLIPGSGDAGQRSGDVIIGNASFSPTGALPILTMWSDIANGNNNALGVLSNNNSASGGVIIKPSMVTQYPSAEDIGEIQGTNSDLTAVANLAIQGEGGKLYIGSLNDDATGSGSILQVNGGAHFYGAPSWFGGGTFLNLSSNGSYMLASAPAGYNAGFTANRDSTSQYASFDLLSSGNVATGWSIQMQPSLTNLNFVDRVNSKSILTFVAGGKVGINTTPTYSDLEIYHGSGSTTFMNDSNAAMQLASGGNATNWWLSTKTAVSGGTDANLLFRIDGNNTGPWQGLTFNIANNTMAMGPDAGAGGGVVVKGIIVDSSGNLSVQRGSAAGNATAYLHIKAGSTAASTAPLKFTTGSGMTTAEAGAMEYTTPDLFFTPGSAIRYNLPLVTGAGVQGDLVYASGASIYSRLAKNTTASRYLSNSGTSNNPAWAQVDLTNGVTGTLPVGNGGTGSTVKNQDNVALTNQGADITTTNFTSGGVAGTYRVSYSLQDTASDITAGAVTLTIAYTDGAGATTTTANQVLTGLGRVSGSIYLQLASGNVTYATSHTGVFGSAKYALYLTLERLS